MEPDLLHLLADVEEDEVMPFPKPTYRQVIKAVIKHKIKQWLGLV